MGVESALYVRIAAVDPETLEISCPPTSRTIEIREGDMISQTSTDLHMSHHTE